MDYKKFLNKVDIRVLPFFGGAWVDDETRRLRVATSVAPGWWEFIIEGRNASAEAEADAPDLTKRPRQRGHFYDNWIFISGKQVQRLNFVPPGACEIFTPVVAREWYQGQLIFESTDFEDDAEINVRDAFEQHHDIQAIKGVPASLRVAFGFATLKRRANARQIPVSIREVVSELAEISIQGDVYIDQLLDRAEARRAEERQRLQQLRQQREQQQYVEQVNRRYRQRGQSPEQYVAEVLEKAGANMLSLRVLEDHMYEVKFEFMEERFISIVHTGNLRIYDAGICLENADPELNLASLPGVIREAIDNGLLYITRHY